MSSTMTSVPALAYTDTVPSAPIADITAVTTGRFGAYWVLATLGRAVPPGETTRKPRPVELSVCTCSSTLVASAGTPVTAPPTPSRTGTAKVPGPERTGEAGSERVSATRT